MKLRKLLLLVLGIQWLAWPAGVSESVHAGPVYTSSGSKTGDKAAGADGIFPVFPSLQILLDPSDADAKLKGSDVRLAVDGKDCGPALKVQDFESGGHGFAAAFTIDVSGSMRGSPLNAVRAGLTRFVDSAGPRDHVAVQTVADEGRWDSGWDASRSDLRKSLANLQARGKLTRLWDGVFEALGSYGGQPLARRLVIVSDGHDEGSSRTVEQVVALSRAQHVAIDTIGLTRSDPIYLKSLESLSDRTGGHFRRAIGEKQLEELIARGLQASRNLPLATFEAGGIKADGKMHRMRVTWKHAGQDTIADVSVALPKIESAKPVQNRRWIVAAVLGALGAALLAGIVFAVRRRKRPEPIPVSAHASTPPPPPAFVRSQTAAGSAVTTPRASPHALPQSVTVASPLPARDTAPLSAAPARPSPALVRTQIAPRFPRPTVEQPCAWLLCEAGFAEGSEFPVNAVEFWMGGLSNNHLCLDQDPMVSANHACIAFEQGALGIFDNESTNGTWVNEQRVLETRQLLWPGDRVRAGRSTFVLLLAPSRPESE